MTVEISFSDLHVPDQESNAPLPVSSLDRNPRSHLHGRLSITINGRELPSLGYWGPDDVCIETWAEQLTRIVEALSASSVAEYTFDEGEQGQPAFRFVRQDETVLISVVDAEFSGGEADPEWQDVACLFEDLRLQTRTFLQRLYAELKRQAPKGADLWWANHLTSIDVP